MTVRQSRPALHFTAERGWINDPNGLVFHDGYWHLFYQHHPDSLQWGPMHWGHARSCDLITWEHLPIALEPGRLGAAFSGSAVVDHDGTAGFGTGAVVAIYTLNSDTGQTQAIAHSSDGILFTPFSGNPVLLQPPDCKDFRDPKVFRYNDSWIMVLAVGTQVWIYQSVDLRNWSLTSRYTDKPASDWGTWETPDLFPLPHPVHGEPVWVLTIGMTSDAPAGGGGTYYRTGMFDGTTFTSTDGTGHWADHGPDFYAPQSWSGTGDRRVVLAWMNNWRYSNDSPHGVSRGIMSLAREVHLELVDGGLLLAQRPVLNLGELAGELRTIPVGTTTITDVGRATACSMNVRGVDQLSFKGALLDDTVKISIDGETRLIVVERSGPVAERIDGFTLRHECLVPGHGNFDAAIVFDSGSVEVFAASGTLSITMLTSHVVMPQTLCIHTTVELEVRTVA